MKTIATAIALQDYEGLDSKGPFPFLHEWGISDPSPTDPSIPSDRFVEGTEVIVKCLIEMIKESWCSEPHTGS